MIEDAAGKIVTDHEDFRYHGQEFELDSRSKGAREGYRQKCYDSPCVLER